MHLGSWQRKNTAVANDYARKENIWRLLFFMKKKETNKCSLQFLLGFFLLTWAVWASEKVENWFRSADYAQ